MTRPVWVPLTVERHGLRRWHRYADFGFARHRRAVPLVLDEVEAVAASLPVVFGPPAAAGLPDDPRTPAVPPADGPPPGLIPLALLASDPAGASPFVSDDGRWLTLYVPALLRVHPFAARATGAGAQMALLVDEASGHVTDDARAERFFDPLGAPSPALEPVIAFFRNYAGFAERTAAAVDALRRLPGLMVPLAAPDLSTAQAEGLWMLDRAAFDALDDAALPALRASGALALAHAHFVALRQVAWLRRAEEARALDAASRDGIASSGARNAPSGPDVTDFLAAMGLAPDDDDQSSGTGHKDPAQRDKA